MQYEVVIGVETHVQLQTKSKMFCACSADYQNATPNTHICPICMGLPGALPSPNQRAVEYAIAIGLSLNCMVAEKTKFDRKHYSYPDLPKGYQISQYDVPICFDGYVELNNGQKKKVRIERVHMEEDVAKSSHLEDKTLLDFNRSGMPLMEIVTKPDFRSAKEVVSYIENLQSIIKFLGVGQASMEKGTFRCDANVSLRKFGAKEFGVKVEIKNMNRIGAVEFAIEYEIKRQQTILDSGEKVQPETRGFVDEKKITASQRRKEEASDYRYLPEPDIPPLLIDQKYIQKIKEGLPKLAEEWKKEIKAKYGLSEYDCSLLVATPSKVKLFEKVLNFMPKDADELQFAKQTANWINGDLTHLISEAKKEFSEIKFEPKEMSILVGKFAERKINNSVFKEVLKDLFANGGSTEKILKDKGYFGLSETDLAKVVDEVLENNTGPVKDVLSGKEQAISFLVGQIMKTTRGQADASLARKLLIEKIKPS